MIRIVKQALNKATVFLELVFNPVRAELAVYQSDQKQNISISAD